MKVLQYVCRCGRRGSREEMRWYGNRLICKPCRQAINDLRFNRRHHPELFASPPAIMMKPILLPCPFCRGIELRLTDNTIGHGDVEFGIRCTCGGSLFDRDEEEVVRKWNRRTPEVKP